MDGVKCLNRFRMKRNIVKWKIFFRTSSIKAKLMCGRTSIFFVLMLEITVMNYIIIKVRWLISMLLFRFRSVRIRQIIMSVIRVSRSNHFLKMSLWMAGPFKIILIWWVLDQSLLFKSCRLSFKVYLMDRSDRGRILIYSELNIPPKILCFSWSFP